MPEATLPGLVAELVASRHAGGYRFKMQERVLRQFAGHCRREGYPDGSITKEAVDGFLYGRHLRSATVRRNELALRQLAERLVFDAARQVPRTGAFELAAHPVSGRAADHFALYVAAGHGETLQLICARKE